jgi:uncharacterized protein (UPF0276 family)
MSQRHDAPHFPPIVATNLTAGLGCRPEHVEQALDARADGLWFEVHAETYMVEGGPRLATLAALRERHPLSLHSVGLSLVSPAPVCPDYLRRLKKLAALTSPLLMSDHLAWQKWGRTHHADFLPFPRTLEALAWTAGNVSRVQDVLGRRILIENPPLYIDLPGHELEEVEFLAELARRSGCGLLVDVNNLFVAAHNLGFDAEAYVDALPAAAIGEIHLAGHSPDQDPGSPLLIDTHDEPVAAPVWRLYRRLLARTGPCPTLIERDGGLVGFAELMAERDRAHGFLALAGTGHA